MLRYVSPSHSEAGRSWLREMQPGPANSLPKSCARDISLCSR